MVCYSTIHTVGEDRSAWIEPDASSANTWQDKPKPDKGNTPQDQQSERSSRLIDLAHHTEMCGGKRDDGVVLGRTDKILSRSMVMSDSASIAKIQAP